MRYVRWIEDACGDLVDLEIYCSATCWTESGLGDPYGHYIPCPEAADYDQHCPQCGRVVVVAIETPSFDGWPLEVA
jgi:hypothetical protein